MSNKTKYRIKQIEVESDGTLGYTVFGKAYQVQEWWWLFGWMNLRKKGGYIYAAFYTIEEAEQFIKDEQTNNK